MSKVALTGNAAGTGTFTIAAPNSNNNRTLTLPDASGTVITADATQTLTNKTLGSGLVIGASTIVSGTAVASTSGTAIDFTGIPSWARRITVIFRQVSLSNVGSLLVQAGVAGTPTTTGYSSITTFVVGGTASGQLSSTSGFIIQAGDATYQVFGHLVLTNVSGNTWVVSGVQGNVVTVGYSVTSSGVVALSGVLGMIRVTSTSGTDTFDAGTINIMWE